MAIDTNLNKFIELPSWDKFIMDMNRDFDSTAKNCFMICGGKGVGKSTFVKYFINRMLAFENVNEVICIDLDPGQPIFSLPANISYYTFSSPLPGPIFSYEEKIKYTYKKEILFGFLSAVVSFFKYYEIAKLLADMSKTKNCPIIVNTMGHTNDVGLSIITSLIRIIKPSFVVNLISEDSSLNFNIPLTMKNINDQVMDYSMCNDNVVNFEGIQITEFQSKLLVSPKERRELRFVAYLKKLFEPQGKMYWSNPMELSFNKCVVESVRDDINVPYQLLAVYQQFIALCEVDKKLFIDHGKNRPKSLPIDHTWMPYCIFHGYGIVIKINHQDKKIFIVTPLSKEKCNTVNTLVLTNNKIPLKMKNEYLGKEIPIEQRNSLILMTNLPWFTWDEFDLVKKWTFSGNQMEMEKALQYIHIWQSRLYNQNDVPLSSTSIVLIGILGLSNSSLSRKLDFAQACASKFVTLTKINKRKRWFKFIHKFIEKYPNSLLLLRKNVNHRESNISLQSCKEALIMELELIKTYYWDRSRQDIECLYEAEQITAQKAASNVKDAVLSNECKSHINPQFLEQLIFKDEKLLFQDRKRKASTKISKSSKKRNKNSN